MENRTTIDFEILWKKINKSLTKEEEHLFDQWIGENEDHQLYFEKALKYFSEGSGSDTNMPDVEAEWQKLESSFKEPKIRRSISWRRAMAVAATVTFIVAGFFVVDFIQKSEETATAAPVIQPGGSKAILTLDNGTSYELDEGVSLNIESGGANIVSEGTAVSYSSETGEPTESQKEMAYNTLVIPRGGEFFVELSDGTKIWINAESTLKYPVQFTGGERNVELIGEAYFEVAHDLSKPFIVTSGIQQIEVVGTEFNITSYEDDEAIVTTLVAGEVNVRRSYGERIDTRLMPNQQSIMTKKTGEIINRDVDPNNFIAWKTGKFYFENTSLMDIMKVLSRWYDIDVFFDNTELAGLQFSGGFERYENFEQVRLIIESTEEVSFIINEKTVIIK